jgi:peptide deformylase
MRQDIQPKKLSFTEWGNPILAKKLKPVPLHKIKSKSVQRLIQDMFFTMSDIGYGIAANQVNKDLHLSSNAS